MLPRFPPLHEGPRRLSWAVGIACALFPAAYLVLTLLLGGRLLSISLYEGTAIAIITILWIAAFFFIPFVLIRLGSRLFDWVRQGFDNPNDGAPRQP